MHRGIAWVLGASVCAALAVTAQPAFAQARPLNIIVFGAHPDDCDIRAAGTAVKWVKAGHHVRFVSLTNGDAGHQTEGGAALGRRRRAEAEESGRRLGVALRTFARQGRRRVLRDALDEDRPRIGRDGSRLVAPAALRPDVGAALRMFAQLLAHQPSAMQRRAAGELGLQLGQFERAQVVPRDLAEVGGARQFLSGPLFRFLRTLQPLAPLLERGRIVVEPQPGRLQLGQGRAGGPVAVAAARLPQAVQQGQLALAIARADMGVLLLHDEAGGMLRPFIAHNMTETQCEQFGLHKLDVGAFGQAMAEHRRIRIRDAWMHGDGLQDVARAIGFRHIEILPFFRRDGYVLGALGMIYRTKHGSPRHAAKLESFWADVMSLNLGSTRRISRAAAPHLIAAAKASGGASIVNLSSLAARNGGGPGSTAYATAKGAMLTFTRGLAREFGAQGVRVNALAPGLILGSSFHATHTPPEVQKNIIAGIPIGRAGNLDDVARAAVFFASEFDGFITGATLDVNGGVYTC